MCVNVFPYYLFLERICSGYKDTHGTMTKNKLVRKTGVGGKYDGDAEMPGSTVSSGCTVVPELPGGQVKKGSPVCYDKAVSGAAAWPWPSGSEGGFLGSHQAGVKTGPSPSWVGW